MCGTIGDYHQLNPTKLTYGSQMLNFIENEKEVLAVVESNCLDAAALNAFKEAAQVVPELKERRFLVDLSAVEFIDSSGVGAVLGLFQASR